MNRVTPFSEFEAASARGLFMGNRGILHDENGIVGSTRWRHKNWIVCALSFEGRKARINAPGHYTQLFFCDEATAFAAGHRPCAECRRADYLRFMSAWQRAYDLQSLPKAGEVDRALHQARLTPDKRQHKSVKRPGDLPDGAMVTLPEEPGSAWLLWEGDLHRWSHSGYTEHRSAVACGDQVIALTPEPTIRVLEAGYIPLAHPTVERH